MCRDRFHENNIEQTEQEGACPPAAEYAGYATERLHGERSSDLEEAARLLRAGETVAFPTETVYGLGANALDAAAVEKIFAAKGRPADNPLSILIYDGAQLRPLVTAVSETAQKLMDAFWPGPLTLIFPLREGALPACVTGGRSSVGVRMPNHPVALRLLELAQVPVAAPSANLSGRPSPTAVAHVEQDLYGRIAAIVSGGCCSVGLESTLLDLCGDVPVLRRPGSVTREALEHVIGGPVAEADPGARGAGLSYGHYRPGVPLYLCGGAPEEAAARIDAALAAHRGQAGVMLSRETLRLLQNDDGNLAVSLGTREDPAQIAGNLFAAMRYLDQNGVTAIYTETFPEEGVGAALMDRLREASGGRILTGGDSDV